MLTLENRTEAVLEAVGDRGEVLAMAHGNRASTDQSVVLVRLAGCEVLVVWWVGHRRTVSLLDDVGEYFQQAPHCRINSITYARAWAELCNRAKRIGWTD